MRLGDYVLLSENGTRAFTWVARISGKLYSPKLGRQLWPYVREKPWDYIFLLNDVISIRKCKRCLVQALGYKPKEHVQHFIRVRQEVVDALLWRHASMANFISCINDIPCGNVGHY